MANENLTGTDPSVPVETPVPLTLRCPRCGAEVPADAGKCPKCGRFLPGNSVAVTLGLRRARFTPVETGHRDELEEQLFAERGGREAVDTITRYQIQEYAELTIHIDRIDAYLGELGTLTKAGRQPAALKTRLDISARRDQIAARIRGEASSDTRSLSPSGLEQVPTQALTLARDLLTRLQQGETLTERELGQLDVLQDAMAGRVSLASDPRSVAAPIFDTPVNTRVCEGDGLILLEPGDVGYVEEIDAPTRNATTAAPRNVATPACAYCGRACCGPEHPAFATLHFLDPLEIAKRDKEATAVMMKMLPYGNPY